MPKPTVLDDATQEFVEVVKKHLDVVDRRYRPSRKKLHLKNSTGKVTLNGKKIGAWYYRNISIYLSYLDERYLKMGLYGNLSQANKEANEMAGRISKQAAKISDDAATSVVVHMGIEAHHFIPQTLLKDFPMLASIFPDKYSMPAVNITSLEHRGSAKLFAQLRSEGSLPGILRNVPKEQQAESITTALNRLVKNFRENAPPVSSLEGERKLTLQIIDEIEKLYDDRFPKMLDQSVDLGQGRSQWTIRRWMDETRQSVKTMK